MTDDAIDALRERGKPFEDAEAALVRAIVSSPPFLTDADEAALRYALNLARTAAVRTPSGADVDLSELVAPLRETLRPAADDLAAPRGFAPLEAVRLVPRAVALARAARERVLEALGDRLPAEALDREVCEKALVLVCGGGGGVGWSYLGAFGLLEQYGLVPRFLAGTSMGAMLLLFRARRLRWDLEEVAGALRGLTFGSLFRFRPSESRYGLPAAMRLDPRPALGRFLADPAGEPLTLGKLAIPLVVGVTGIRNGALPRDPRYYAHLLDLGDEEPRPNVLSRVVTEVFQAVGELLVQRDRFARIHLGADDETRDFDALDAAGFSSALPGVIHYDVLREDDRMHAILGGLLARHDLFRLVDGALVDILPARAAWAAVQRGAAGSRNAFVLALEGFAPKLTQPLWYGLEQLASQNVGRNRPFIHLLRSFQRTLSPMEVVPDEDALRRAVQSGKAELHPDMAFVARMVRPFASLAA